ncbi:hypothetical protein RB195_024487 [Necator americanus]|uniref:Uncharacterized protein n=1 Tax=Necator americanus TaxID=51031 RepID=A0ABR1ENH4_NECAM
MKIIVGGDGNRPMARLVRRSTTYSLTVGCLYLKSQRYHIFAVILINISFVRKYDSATRWKRTSAIGNGGEKKSSTMIAYSKTSCSKVTSTSRRTQTWTTRCCSEYYEPVLSVPRRRTLRLDPNASHIERLVSITSCRKALQENLSKYRQKNILGAAEGRTGLKKCRRDLRKYTIPLAALLSEDGTRTSSRCEMEIITERFYSNLFRSSTPVSRPIIPTGEAPPRILPSEVRVAIKGMKPGTAPGLDFISAYFLGVGGHPLHVILAAHLLS